MDFIFKKFLLGLLLLPLTAEAQVAKSILWKVSDQVGHSGYLYGSIHLSDPAFTAWPGSVKACFDLCTVVAGELNLMEIDDLFSSAKLMLMEDSTLRQFYLEKDYAFVKSHLKKKLDPMTFFMVDRIKPFFTLTSLYEGQQNAETLRLIPDYRIQQWAQNANKEVVGLETAGEQMAVIDKMSYRDQAVMLLDALKENDEFELMAARMKELYLKQDIEALLALGEEDKLTKQMEEALLFDRNTKMAERLHGLLANDVVFCVVGAAHLAGENGMLKKMEALGYIIEPVFFEFENQ